MDQKIKQSVNPPSHREKHTRQKKITEKDTRQKNQQGETNTSKRQGIWKKKRNDKFRR